LKPEQVNELEPHVRSLGGLKVPSTGIVDFRRVCLKYVDLIRATGGELRLKSQVMGIQAQTDFQVVDTTSGAVETKCLVNCAGLHCDRVARLAGLRPPAKIVPFRGEYYELVPDRRSLVKNLIYPVPNPDFPFLGVHFTRMIDGSVHAGPNAVLSFKREGYHRTDFSLRDFTEVMAYAGFWKMVVKNGREGMKEIVRSFSKKAFVRSLQTLIPEVREADVVPSAAGVRAQALQADGKLVDDFLILHAPRAVHVLNAPSPAATASLEIGQAIVAEVPEV
jgi:L-2-hydroxyglutarate oxidase